MGWSQHQYLAGMVLALAVSIGLRLYLPRHRQPTDGQPTTMAYLRGGPRSAVVTALAMLYIRGTVRPAKQGTVHRVGTQHNTDDIVESAVYGALFQLNGPRGLRARPDVRRALGRTSQHLVAARLLVPTGQWWASRVALVAAPVLGALQLAAEPITALSLIAVPVGVIIAAAQWLYGRRTRVGRAAVRALRRKYPAPVAESRPQPARLAAFQVGQQVALYGPRALNVLMPRIAKAGGLLDGGPLPDYSLGDGTVGVNWNLVAGGWR